MSHGSQRIERDETHTATQLHVSDIQGTVEVRVGKTAAMQVRITGPEKLVKQIRSEVREDVLHIRSSHGALVAHRREKVQNNVFSSSGGLIFGDAVLGIGKGGVQIGSVRGKVVSDDRVVSGGGGVSRVGFEQVRIVVDVVRQTPVTIDEVLLTGSYQIGDIEGPLDLWMKSGKVTAGRMAATGVVILGSSEVEIGAVNGRALHIAITGSGRVTVREGEVDNLDISVLGTGGGAYGGTTTRADLRLVGPGGIRVNKVITSVDDRSVGDDDISVDARPRRSPGTFWS